MIELKKEEKIFTKLLVKKQNIDDNIDDDDKNSYVTIEELNEMNELLNQQSRINDIQIMNIQKKCLPDHPQKIYLTKEIKG